LAELRVALIARAVTAEVARRGGPVAALARTERGKHGHQRRIPPDVLADAAEELSRVDLGSCRTFEAVLLLVGQAIWPIRGVGS